MITGIVENGIEIIIAGQDEEEDDGGDGSGEEEGKKEEGAVYGGNVMTTVREETLIQGEGNNTYEPEETDIPFTHYNQTNQIETAGIVGEDSEQYRHD